jgi:hypothetical protein
MASHRFGVRNQIDHDVKPCDNKLIDQLTSVNMIDALNRIHCL